MVQVLNFQLAFHMQEERKGELVFDLQQIHPRGKKKSFHRMTTLFTCGETLSHAYLSTRSFQLAYRLMKIERKHCSAFERLEFSVIISDDVKAAHMQSKDNFSTRTKRLNCYFCFHRYRSLSTNKSRACESS